MNRFSVRATALALALAVVSAPALAGGRHGGGYWGGGHHGGYGGYGGGYHHYHGGGGSSSDGWWVGGAFALAAIGLLLAADSGPSYAQAGVYAPGVGYTPPPVYGAPTYPDSVYETPQYQPPEQPQYVPPPQYEQAAPMGSPQAGASSDCQRWAMNQSGYDPAHISQWTTQVSVDTYNRMLQSCMAAGREYTN